QPSIGFLLQSAKPNLHCPTPHWAFMQVAEALAGTGQAMPQPPQFITSLAAFTSQPFPAMRSQSEKPGEQRMISQAPPAHAWTLLAPMHVRAQAPQFFGSAWMATSQPFFTRLSQSAKPRLHEAMRQLPPWHVGEALGVAQAFMQLPQWVTS